MAQKQPYSYTVTKDPISKADLIDRMLRRDFTGDLNDLAANRDLQLARLAANKLRLHFGTSNKDFDIVIKMPRSEEFAEKARQRWFERHPEDKGKSSAPDTKRKPGRPKREDRANH